LSKPFPAIDGGLARRRFARAAATYGSASRLEAEVGSRMLERLDYVKLAPRRVLDAGSGPPSRTLGKRYPHAQVIALDFALDMLRASRFSWFQKKPLRVCADLARLPLADASVELVWCNMALHWLSAPLEAFHEFRRVLAPEGLLMFATLGPDTLKELRAAAPEGRVHAFADMHDVGDALVAAGFSAPVMDMELLELAYPKSEGLLDDLRASGQTNARIDRPRGLAGKAFLKEILFRMQTRATFEVVYGHAWRPAPRSEPAAKTVRVFKHLP
jgi:malonyl-CoA O-methyltransferase